MRIVSICPSNTELLVGLGLENHIVGIDDYSDWPPNLQHLPKLGPDLSIDMEKVKALEPDWVLASLSVPGMEKNIEALEQGNLPHLVLAPNRLEDIAADFITVSKKAGIEKRGRWVAHCFQEQLANLQKMIPPTSTPPRLYWEWWPKPVFTPGKDNWLTDISRLVGGINIFGEEKGQSVQTTWKEVAYRQPDYTLVAWTGVPLARVQKRFFLERPEWQGHSFARLEKIHLLEEGWYCRPSQRILTGIYHLAHLLYPHLFPPVDPTSPLPSYSQT